MAPQAVSSATEIIYPDSDEKPMADNTLQFRWIVTIQGNLDALYRDDPDVFVAGDLLWYPVESEPTVRVAPDVLVAFGCPKGERGSYQQWQEGNVAPQVVFEILSPGNTVREMNQKLAFYDRHGVEEYYLYDPYDVEGEAIFGWLRSSSGHLSLIRPISGWISPRLRVRFAWEDGSLDLYQPDGERFVSFVDLTRLYDEERRRRERAEQERDRLAARLRELGIDPDQEGE